MTLDELFARPERSEPRDPFVSNGHRWPCMRFYTTASDRDECTCGGDHAER